MTHSTGKMTCPDRPLRMLAHMLQPCTCTVEMAIDGGTIVISEDRLFIDKEQPRHCAVKIEDAGRLCSTAASLQAQVCFPTRSRMQTTRERWKGCKKLGPDISNKLEPNYSQKLVIRCN